MANRSSLPRSKSQGEGDRVPTIDVQVHTYERNHPGRPRATTPDWPAEVNGEQMVAAMDEVGVDGAILVSSYTDVPLRRELRRGGAQQASRTASRVVKPVDPADPEVADTIADWEKTPGTVGIRIMMAAGPLVGARRSRRQPRAGRGGRACIAGQRAELGPRWSSSPRSPRAIPTRASWSTTSASCSPSSRRAPPEPWADLPKLLALRQARRTSWSRSAAPARCQQRAVPLQGHLGSAAAASSMPSASTAACGAPTGRARWRSSTYKEGVDAVPDDRPPFSDSDRATLMGGTVQKVYGWAPSGKAS